MQTFLEVLKDLWDFAIGKITFFKLPNNVRFEEPSLPVEVNRKIQSIEKLPSGEVSNETAAVLVAAQGDKAYVAVESARVFQRPVWAYDSAIQKLKYATEVKVIEYVGRFAHITISEKFGWILKDEITSNRADIFPDFQKGEIYSSNHPDTKKLRSLIDDEFFATELFLPLQSVEYVTYSLFSDNRKISWPDTRPRMAGDWQNILKGNRGVQIGVFPRAGSVIEYTKTDGSGWVGYTKAVHVDDSIVVCGVSRIIDGEYKEEQITKDEWHEWRPVWISVT